MLLRNRPIIEVEGRGIAINVLMLLLIASNSPHNALMGDEACVQSSEHGQWPFLLGPDHWPSYTLKGRDIQVKIVTQLLIQIKFT